MILAGTNSVEGTAVAKRRAACIADAVVGAISLRCMPASARGIIGDRSASRGIAPADVRKRASGHWRRCQ